MSRVKQISLQLGFQAGVFRLMQFVRRHQAVILTFHRFSGNGEGDPRGLPVRKLSVYMEYLTKNYRVVSLSKLTSDLRRGVLRPNTAAVTVDDGYHEVSSLAAPVFRRYGVPACIFVVTDFTDGRLWLWTDHFRFVFQRAPHCEVVFRYDGRTHVLRMRNDAHRLQAEEEWREYAKSLPVVEREQLLETIAEACGVTIPAAVPDEYRPMTWTQLRALAAEGFEIGAHTRTHPVLSRVAPQHLEGEIAGSKEQIERNVGIQVTLFAYPNGGIADYSHEVLEAVATAQYLAAVTTVAGGSTPTTPILELRRIDGSADDLAHFAQSLSGVDLLKERLGSMLRSPSWQSSLQSGES